jgi:hypothetical protein
VQIPAGGTTLAVRTAIISDALDEGDHTFLLKATNTGGSTAQGTGTIDDHGGGSKWGDDPPATPPVTGPGPGFDDDRPLSVNNITLSEASPFAIFTISGSPGQFVKLELASDTATVGEDTATELQWFDGTTWQDYTPGSFVQIPAGGPTLLVRVAIIQDGVLESINGVHERFILKATNTGGTTASGSATLTDDGSSDTVFEADNTTGESTKGIADDDRPKPPPPPPPPPPVVAVETPPPPLAPVELPPPPVFRPIEAPPPPVLVLDKGITDQFIDSSAGVTTFNLPADAFTHSNAAARLTLTAQQPNGDPLPSWLQFNPQSGTFQAAPPPGFVGQIEIAVTARDEDGREVTAIFKFNIGQGQAAPVEQGGQAAPQGQPAQQPSTPGPQGRSSLTDQLRQAARRGGLVDMLRAQSDRIELGRGALGAGLDRALADRTVANGGLLERLMASRTVQDRLAQRVEGLSQGELNDPSSSASPVGSTSAAALQGRPSGESATSTQVHPSQAGTRPVQQVSTPSAAS